ncbi:PE-PGRS family protein, partial [Streptomyces sp. PA03-6a]|nr:PE-PGRS family protein [Streptomyces sp. PA03-6a]
PPVLTRLLGITSYLLSSALPPSVVDAAIAHTDWKVRGGLAEHQRGMTPEQWTGLALGESDAARRETVVHYAGYHRARLTPEGYARLAADPSPLVRATAAVLPGFPDSLLVLLAGDPDPGVRAAACPRVWAHLPSPTREALRADPSPRVRAAALLRHHEDDDHPMPADVFEALDRPAHAVAACRLDHDLAARLAADGDPAVRRALAGNPHLQPDLVTRLAADDDNDVRVAVSVRPELTELQRAAVRAEIDTHRKFDELPWVVALHDDPEAMRRLAQSGHVFLRRSVARAARLPADVAELLARDEDRAVRLFLAESCQDAPPDMLLEVWGWWTGSFSVPDRPRGHPNFPRAGLLRFADDPDPRMRRLALEDPESTAELVDRFSRDPDQEVRMRAAEDPRLTPAAAARLADDPASAVWYRAARHPSLPAWDIVRLLRKPVTAEWAAQNPAIPVAVMHRLIDEAALA